MRRTLFLEDCSAFFCSLVRGRMKSPVDLTIVNLETDIGDIGVGSMGGFGMGGTGGGSGLGDGSRDWEIVGLPELDNTPMIRSAIKIPYPKVAIDRNVQQFRVYVLVVIDEEGRTHPIRILKNPFPSINKEIMEFVSSAIFTPPTKQGVPVRAEYLWPLGVKNPSPKKR